MGKHVLHIIATCIIFGNKISDPKQNCPTSCFELTFKNKKWVLAKELLLIMESCVIFGKEISDPKHNCPTSIRPLFYALSSCCALTVMKGVLATNACKV